MSLSYDNTTYCGTIWPGEHTLLQIFSRGQTLRKSKFANTELKIVQLSHWPSSLQLHTQQSKHCRVPMDGKTSKRKEDKIKWIWDQGNRSEHGRMFFSLFKVMSIGSPPPSTQRLISFSVVVRLGKLHHVHYSRCVAPSSTSEKWMGLELFHFYYEVPVDLIWSAQYMDARHLGLWSHEILWDWDECSRRTRTNSKRQLIRLKPKGSHNNIIQLTLRRWGTFW